jgi:predicted lipoprotein with Yx(FWY)xxD motif
MRRNLILPLAAVTGFAAAAAAVAGIAGAKSYTLEVASGAKVTNQSMMTKREAIAVTQNRRAVYWLSGDSQQHQKCTSSNGCFMFWPPVKVQSANNLNKAPGIKGKLGVWRHDGFMQLTLAGHPLYHFAEDKSGNSAAGDGIHGFGGIWHVATATARGGSGGGTTSMPTSMPTTTMPTTTTTCAYPGYC